MRATVVDGPLSLVRRETKDLSYHRTKFRRRQAA
jgi:hypothetical protein